MKKALFAYQYGMANAGDFAINIGSLDLLSEFYDDISILSKQTRNDPGFNESIKYINKYYPNYNVIEGPFDLDRKSFYKTFKSYTSGVLKYPFYLIKGRYYDETINTNIVYLNGGNILRCASLTDYVRLFALVFPLKLAIKNDKPFVLLPHSTTSIDNRGKRLLKPLLNKAKLVFAREELSYELLKANFPKANIQKSIDSAFFIKDRDSVRNAYNKKYSGEISSNTVCITMRKEDIGDIGELSSSVIDKIEETMVKLITDLLNQEHKVSLIIQTSKDLEFTKTIYNQFSNDNISIIEEYDPLLLREIYRNSKCLYGMRLHSMILAMSVGTPVIGYFEKRWGIKNPGTLEQFNMPFSFIEDGNDLLSYMVQAMNNEKLMNIEIKRKKKLVIDNLREVVLEN